MGLFKKAKKNRSKWRRAYRSGYDDSQKHWSQQINDQRKMFQEELSKIRLDADMQVKLIRNTYKEKEKNFNDMQVGLANAAKFWLNQADKLNEINSESISFMSEFDETVDNLLKLLGHMKRLKNKTLHNNEKLHNHMHQSLKKQPRLIQ